MWYAVWVRSGQENRVLELCKTFRHYHPDAYEECFIPTYEKYRKVKGQPTKQLAHLLPGYLFFVSDHPQELQKLLKRIPEFAKTLGDDDGAIPLYQEEVEFLQRYTGDERILKMSEGYLVGSELVVTDGPLKDYQGKVMKIDRHKRTAVLELEFLGRKTKVTVGLEIVRKFDCKCLWRQDRNEKYLSEKSGKEADTYMQYYGR